MSRTYRRKNFERELPRTEGSKINGYYTHHDYEGDREVYRMPSSQERFTIWWWAHGDHGCKSKFWGYHGLSPWQRNCVEKQHRGAARRKISRFLHGKTDDVVLDRLRKYPKWFW